MEFKLVEKIRERSREEWVRWANQKLVDIRIWLQEHGEAALGIGIVAGVVVVVEFFNVLVLLVLLAAAAFVVWSIALPGTATIKSEKTPETAQGEKRSGCCADDIKSHQEDTKPK